MYEYVEDKRFVRQMRQSCGSLMQELCHQLKEDYDLGTSFSLVGSGKRNMILQSGNEAIDLDYNLEITRCEDYEDCRYIKECVRKTFNKVLKMNNLPDCEDSKSALTTKKFYFEYNPTTLFSFDVAIIYRDDEDNSYKLIHKKTWYLQYDEYYWNEMPDPKDIRRKEDIIKINSQWAYVYEEYKKIKNIYLQQNQNRKSFTCYVEAVNNIYNTLNQNKSRNYW